MKHLLAVVVPFLVVGSFSFSQNLIRVPQDQPTVQAGINASANGDTVLVAEGTYTENLKVNKKIILGSLFVQDGDTSHISKTIIDGSGSSNPDSGSTITLGPETDTTLLITGFTIRGGKGNKAYDSLGFIYWLAGGGIETSVGGSARIVHNIVTGNHLVTTGTVDSVYAGGIGIVVPYSLTYSRYVIIEDNTISDNSVDAVAVEAGGIGVYGVSGRIVGNIIENNAAQASTAYCFGGGITIQMSNVLLSRNLIRGNTSTTWGGGLALDGWTNTGLYMMYNNIVCDNIAPNGAGAHIGGPTITEIVNNTFVNNVGTSGAGIRVLNESGITVRALNNIFSNTNASTQIVQGAGTLYFQNNLIFGQAFGTNSINADPDLEQFSGYYYLHSGGSPARNAGMQSATVGGVLLTAPSKDYRGSTRDGTPDLGAHEFDPLVGVENTANSAMLESFALTQNYPNPFNPTTKITYSLPFTVHCSLKIFDLLGREVATLVNEEQSSGRYHTEWNATVPSGVYFYRLSAVGKDGKGFAETKKMILVR